MSAVYYDNSQGTIGENLTTQGGGLADLIQKLFGLLFKIIYFVLLCVQRMAKGVKLDFFGYQRAVFELQRFEYVVHVRLRSQVLFAITTSCDAKCAALARL